MQLIKAIALFLALFSILSCEDELSPVAAFNADKTKLELGKEVKFTNLSKNADSYTWNFGDGHTSIEKDPTHIFTKTGNYKVSLEAIGVNGKNKTEEDILVFDEINIFPGNKVMGINLGESWETVEAKLSTTYVVDTSIVPLPDKNDPEVWERLIIDKDNGLALYLIQELFDFAIQPDDWMLELVVFGDYYGSTDEGVSIGSTKEFVKEVYGQPGLIEDNGETYVYTQKGIVFLFESDKVIQMHIFPVAGKSSDGYSRPIGHSFIYFTNIMR